MNLSDLENGSREWQLVARLGHRKVGRACPLCPGISDVHLFGYRQGVVDLDPEITDCAFDLGVTE